MKRKARPILPETIRIGFHDYLVEYTDDDSLNINGQPAIGALLDDAKFIKISLVSNDYDLPNSTVAQTIMHEVLHAIDYATEARIFDGKEGQLDAFASYLCMLIRDNPDYMRMFK